MTKQAYLINQIKRLNPVGNINPTKLKYQLLWTNYDINQYCSYMNWHGLPDGYKSWSLNRMLYYAGSVAAFNIAGQVYILKYIIEGTANDSGLPSRIRPVDSNGNFVGGDKIYTVDKDCCILYDAVTDIAGEVISRFTINNTIIEEIADTLARISINVSISTKKLLLQIKDEAQKEIVKKELDELFDTASPYGIITGGLEHTSIQSTNDYYADDLFNTVKNWDAIRCFMSGIASKNFGTEKKERLVSGELAGNDEQIDLIADLRLEMAKDFTNKCNELFGTNIQVSLRTDSYDDDINGNGLTQKEEEEAL